MTLEEIFKRDGEIYGVSYKYEFGWRGYVLCFNDLQQAIDWINTEQYDFRERQLGSKDHCCSCITTCEGCRYYREDGDYNDYDYIDCDDEYCPCCDHKLDLDEEIADFYNDDIQKMYDNFSKKCKYLCDIIDCYIDEYSIDELENLLQRVIDVYDYIAVNMQIENGEDDEEYDTLHESDFIYDYRDKLRVALNIADDDDDGDIIDRLIYDNSSYDELESKLAAVGYADDYKKYITAEISSFDLHRY